MSSKKLSLVQKFKSIFKKDKKAIDLYIQFMYNLTATDADLELEASML